ncbi:MAG: hypothetical protein AAFQ94_17800 [Bacteroidota bacterium]
MSKKRNTAIPKGYTTQERIDFVAKEVDDKELFPEKVELAKKTLANIKSLPI